MNDASLLLKAACDSFAAIPRTRGRRLRTRVTHPPHPHYPPPPSPPPPSIPPLCPSLLYLHFPLLFTPPQPHPTLLSAETFCHPACTKQAVSWVCVV